MLKSEALLREQSVRDHLTGLYNRRYLEETLARELLRASRKQLPMGIIILPEAPQVVTYERARLICDNSKLIELHWEGKILDAITLSLGVATFPADGFTSTAVLQSVDAALYRAKNEGRGQVALSY